MPDFFDTHCHLDAAEFDADRDAIHARAFAAGVVVQVVPAVTRDNFAAVAATCARYRGCLPAWGLHPMLIGAHRPEHLSDLRAQIEMQRPVAVGEIGLDLFVRELDYATQEYFYVEQLKIARDYDLPVLLHGRRASDLLLKQLRRIPVRGIAHAFNGSRQQADAFIKLGFKLGFGGAFTWPRANQLRRLAVELPLEAIVLETDSPDIPPAWVGRGRNSPGELPGIARTLAELRGVDTETVARVTTQNAREVLALAAA
ncbi:putative TatD related DNase [Thiobacillus denitrificans ATCC 25259]|uniref:Putative TatD related DNase n=1 Tax=Thiobacillus denitrificans (strain ATCC 25259 / T1) TaxID=292415 RepID=Q3SLG9_THIDA|nr:TatD family hydrolase [Thiobacillus denitrificans]AAZ96441.1 putative TatD related DNase [Thiobacillus denitrificans ATCC 25259]